jgi:ABC-type transport system involved in multi-copper enzyme maturation permease subunit
MSVKKISAIAKVTSKEFTQTEVVLAIIFLWLAIMLVSLAFATVSIGQRVYVLSDLGLCIANIFTILLIVIGGSNLLSKEIKKKSIYTVLSKPISRTSYLLGKFLGLWLASLALNILLHLLLVLFILLFEAQFISVLFINVWYVALQSLILSAICFLASSIMVTPALVGITTFAVFIAGQNITVLTQLLSESSPNSATYRLVYIAESVLPSLASINVADLLTYQQIPGFFHATNSLLYTICYTAMILVLTVLALQKREFN